MFRGCAGSRNQGYGQWARSEAQREFYSHHHSDMFCQCPYGDAPAMVGQIAVYQECREMCCDYSRSGEAKP